MNNAMIMEQESKDDQQEAILGKRQGELIKIVEALQRVSDSREWEVLKKLVFDGVVETLERKLKSEAQKATVNDPELYRLQGQLVWARKYADLNKLVEFFKVELEGITLKIKHDKTNSADGAA